MQGQHVKSHYQHKKRFTTVYYLLLNGTNTVANLRPLIF